MHFCTIAYRSSLLEKVLAPYTILKLENEGKTLFPDRGAQNNEYVHLGGIITVHSFGIIRLT